MDMVIQETLFSAEQWGDINSLINGLDNSQKKWLGEYLWHLVDSDNSIHNAKPELRTVVAYGTETGNCRAIAERFFQQANQHNKPVELIDLAQFKIRHLKQIDSLFVICSTHGDGDPPEPIERFYETLLAEDKSLSPLSYSVLALGDSSYDKFCETGRQIDNKLAALGASRLQERVECDVDYQSLAESWIATSLSHIAESQSARTSSAPILQNSSTTEISKANPLTVELLESIRLSAAERNDPIYHLEIELPDQHGLNLLPGDSVGIFPENTPQKVSQTLELLNLLGDEIVTLKDESYPLAQALRQFCDLNIISNRFVKKWAELTQSETLEQLVNGDQKILKAYLGKTHLHELLVAHPGEMDAQTLVDWLRPLQPRLYDVANNPFNHDNELHITVERCSYLKNGNKHYGIASHFLTTLEVGENISLFPQRNKKFHLPDNPSVPLLMIAVGSGISPYRAFIQHIANASQRNHPAWLIFKENSFHEDFLYQTDWLEALRNNDISRIDTLFTEETPTDSLTDKLLQNLSDFIGWIESGAHLYLSGHKHELKVFEDEFVQAIANDQHHLAVWHALIQQKRIHRNLY